MKAIFLAALIFSVLSFKVQSQSLIPFKKIDTLQFKVKYDLVFQPDSTDYQTSSEVMILLVGMNSSIFMSYNTFRMDSIMMSIKNDAEFQHFRTSHLRQQSSMPRFFYRIHKNYPAGEVTFTDIIMPNFFQYAESYASFNWKLTESKKRFKGYDLQNATTYYGGREWNAWFTTSIPIMEGPYKFAGLPGLIISISDSEGHYRFSLTSLERPLENEYIKIPLDLNPIRTTREKFLKSYLEYTQNPYHAMEGLIEADPLDIEVRRRQTLRRNNPIELKAD